MLMQNGNGFRMRARSVFRRIFHLLTGWLGIRRWKKIAGSDISRHANSRTISNSCGSKSVPGK